MKILRSVGWQDILLRRYGCLAQYLNKVITKNQFKPLPHLEPERSRFLPTKFHRWFRDSQHRISFGSQEMIVFQQVSLGYLLRFMEQHLLIDKVDLQLQMLSFPSLGFLLDDIQFCIIGKYPNQGIGKFKAALDSAKREMETNGQLVRWIIPFSDQFEPCLPRSAEWFELDSEACAHLTNPSLEETQFHLHLNSIQSVLSP